MVDFYPIFILITGIFAVVVMISVLRLNAFIALISSAIIVSLLAPGDLSEKISRVAVAFGNTAGGIGIVIALATVVGKCMMDSGSADRIVRCFLSLLGEKRGGTALMASGFILSVPVFFDTVFYLLVPLARSMYKRTKKHYLRYILAITAGGVITHMLVPPTPGPLIMAKNLGIDLGIMIIIGALVALPSAIVGMLVSHWRDKRLNIPMRPLASNIPEPEPIRDKELPGLFVSILPIILPVFLVSTNTVMKNIVMKSEVISSSIIVISDITSIIGNVNFAMLISAVISMLVLFNKRRLNRNDMSKVIEESLMSGGIIILITAAGGAFGAMLKEAQIGQALEKILAMKSGLQLQGLLLLGTGFIVASVIKIAQGSGTVAMITTSAMIGAMITSPGTIGFHPVYLATAIGGGAMIFSWMNDSGFWIFVKMGGFTEAEGLKSWTPLLATVGLTAFIVTLLLATLFPMV